MTIATVLMSGYLSIGAVFGIIGAEYRHRQSIERKRRLFLFIVPAIVCAVIWPVAVGAEW